MERGAFSVDKEEREMERVPVTKNGFMKLKDRLRNLKEVERPANVADIERALEHGDLKENSEYHAAKEKQSFIAGTIAMLEDRISRAQVIDPTELSGDRVTFGATVTLLNLDSDEEVKYQIVGDDEADIKGGSISISSPIGRALIGKNEGDDVEVRTPGGAREYEIVTVEFV